ncbi:methyl-accepting chemotaxis protein [Indioceanicola profundi]|uniref:methyl-accepting chemotaxis protein n=1 Tax=Indioceanicola profundi TaxID=2220096 RepID=UPI000E6AC956|nr:methyl-accepting chemotaxis protein [Indioceanicola profundi]
MTLVKKSRFDTQNAAERTVAAPEDRTPVQAPNARATAQRKRARSQARQQQVAERLGTASAEMASSITQAASAAEQLRRAMEQISRGAEQASSASHESLAAINQIAASFAQARERASAARLKTENLQIVLAESGTQVAAAIAAIGANADRQSASVALVQDLQRQAASIGNVVGTVAHIADQTNLLALNAAIEAARAGQAGAGFAVVADEVRVLAETAEKSAREITDLVARIQQEVDGIVTGITAAATAARAEAENGRKVAVTLERIRTGMTTLVEGSIGILASAQEAERAAREVQKGAEQIAAAAEEQSAATEESLRGLGQQAQALDQAQAAAHELATLAEDLGQAADLIRSAEEVASASEELSATVQELSGAATQIMAAINQISRGAQQQAAAAQQSSAALSQIERNASSTRASAADALQGVNTLSTLVREGRGDVEAMIAGVERALGQTRQAVGLVVALEQVGRRIDKIVGTIDRVSIQTNMLAVSGSVEAARAGEHGRGFAVVSGDIRNLAQESAENTDQVRDTVRAMQDQVQLIRRELEQSVAASEVEIQKNRTIISTLAGIETDTDALRAGNDEVARAAAAVLEAVEQAVAGTEEIATAAEEASRSAAEAATAAGQQARGTEDLAAAIEEISSLADELQNSGT